MFFNAGLLSWSDGALITEPVDSSEGNDTYPFYLWPDREIKIDECKANENITLTYVIHNCNTNIKVFVGDMTEPLDEESYSDDCVPEFDNINGRHRTRIIRLSLNPLNESKRIDNDTVPVIVQAVTIKRNVTSYLLLQNSSSEGDNDLKELTLPLVWSNGALNISCTCSEYLSLQKEHCGVDVNVSHIEAPTCNCTVHSSGSIHAYPFAPLLSLILTLFSVVIIP